MARAGKAKIKVEDFVGTETDSFDSGLAAEKMPTDVRGGKEPLEDYMSVPLNMIDEFSLKEGSDFSPPPPDYLERMIESIKTGGVIEAVTLRPKPGGRYEVIAGATRCRAAREAGEKTIPAHITDVDNEKARRIFAYTNLLRRELTIRDRINGWWHYYMSAKKEGALGALRGGTLNGELNEYAPTGERINYRQIMRYVNLHDLPSEWIDLMEVSPQTGKPGITIFAGLEVLKLSEQQQKQILPHAAKLNERTLKELVKLSNGELKDKDDVAHEWTEENVARLIAGEDLNSEKTEPTPENEELEAQVRSLQRMKKQIMNVARGSLHAEDYSRAPEVIKEALELYYSQKS